MIAACALNDYIVEVAWVLYDIGCCVDCGWVATLVLSRLLRPVVAATTILLHNCTSSWILIIVVAKSM